MGSIICPQCGAPIDPGVSECKYCGEKIIIARPAAMQQNVQQPHVQQPNYQQPNFQQQPLNGQQFVQNVYVQQSAINPAWPIKSKVAAGLLGIFLGGFGIHKFYLGKVGKGILYLIFCWTYIPAFIGFIEGIVYLCSNDENFQLKHHVRLR